jgi:hypothetical protein
MLGVVASGPGPDPGPVDYIGASVLGVAWVLVLLRATRMRVELSDVGVRMFHYFDTPLVPWVDTSDVAAGYYGLAIILKDGTSLRTTALGKSNWSTSTGTRSSADDAVEAILTALREQPGP